MLNKAIKELIENKSLNENIAINGKKMVDNYYHKEIMANSLIKLFEEIDRNINSLNVN